jgi:hypothetical protein
MLTTYTLDGQQTVFQFNWPYLDRSHIMVTVNLAARPFKFIDDHTISVKSLFGEPLPAGETLKIFRVTPDLDAFAEFKDAANLSSTDLNRARLQCLYLIQERSGGLGGSVGHAVQLLVNEIETISGALDTLAFSQGLLTAGLETLDDLGSKIDKVENEGTALQEAIDKAIEDMDTATSTLNQRMTDVEAHQSNLAAQVTTTTTTLVNNDQLLASQITSLSARVDGIDLNGDGDTTDPGEDLENLAASLIISAIAEAKDGVATAKRIDTLQAEAGGALALLQVEQLARASADQALASQITALQAEIGDNLAQVLEEMSATVDAVDGKVTGLQAQYTLKTSVTRADGKAVMAGIGLASTANSDYTGSEIVLMADKLVFADPNTPDGALKPMFIAGSVDGSPTFIVPSSVIGDRTYPGRILVDGTIEGRSIKANELTGDKLKAGSISTREIDVNLGVNILSNAEFVDVSSGWPTGWSFGGTALAGAQMLYDPYHDYTLAGGHTIDMREVSTDGNMNILVHNAYTLSPSVPVSAGSRYEFSAYTGVHSAKCYVQVQFLASDLATVLGTSVIDADTTNDREAVGGRILTDYKRIGGFAIAPAATAAARLLVVRGSGYPTAPSNSHCFITKPMIAEAKPFQTRLSPYTVSGLGTKITPGGITTPSLSALSANIGFLMSGVPGGQRTELDGNGVRAYYSNGQIAVRVGTW